MPYHGHHHHHHHRRHVHVGGAGLGFALGAAAGAAMVQPSTTVYRQTVVAPPTTTYVQTQPVVYQQAAPTYPYAGAQVQTGYPVQAPVAAPPMYSAQPELPPAGSRIHITSLTTNRNVRVNPNGVIDSLGGNGQWATFIVSPNNGYLRLMAEGHPGKFLAIRNGSLGLGPGGPACELALATISPGVFMVQHARGHGNLAFEYSGFPLAPGPWADQRAQFRYSFA